MASLFKCSSHVHTQDFHDICEVPTRPSPLQFHQNKDIDFLGINFIIAQED